MNIVSIRILVLLAIFLGSGFASRTHVCSQDWIQQAPYPADVDLLGVHFSSPTDGWISGNDDLLMRTTDGGLTWTQTSSVNRSPQFSEDPIWDVQFVDELHGWAWGNHGYRTTAWLKTQPDQLVDKLANHGLCPPNQETPDPQLAVFVEAFIMQKQSEKVQDSTIQTYRQVQNNLLEFFPKRKRLSSVSGRDASEFRGWLISSKSYSKTRPDVGAASHGRYSTPPWNMK